jgi:single-strand DNA-binding protein
VFFYVSVYSGGRNHKNKLLRKDAAVAGSINKVILVGNLGNDPDVRTMQSGSKICNLSVATSESWKDRTTGERKERTEWHRVVIFNEPIAKVAESYLRKGSKVYIEGQIETRKWTDNSGVEKYTTEIVLRPYTGQLTMLDSAGGAGASGGGGFGGGSQQQSGGGFGGGSQQQDSGGFGGGNAESKSQAAPIDDLEDEIPF